MLNSAPAHLVHERGDGGVEHEGDEEEEGEDADDAEGAEHERDVVLQVLEAAPAQVGLRVLQINLQQYKSSEIVLNLGHLT